MFFIVRFQRIIKKNLNSYHCQYFWLLDFSKLITESRAFLAKNFQKKLRYFGLFVVLFNDAYFCNARRNFLPIWMLQKHRVSTDALSKVPTTSYISQILKNLTLNRAQMNGLQQPQLMDSQWHKKNRGWITRGLIKKKEI